MYIKIRVQWTIFSLWVGVRVLRRVCTYIYWELLMHAILTHFLVHNLVHGIWSIWIKDRCARDYMINIVKVIELEGRAIEIHDLYPTSKIISNENILFKDLPPGVNDTTIIIFLMNNQVFL